MRPFLDFIHLRGGTLSCCIHSSSINSVVRSTLLLLDIVIRQTTVDLAQFIQDDIYCFDIKIQHNQNEECFSIFSSISRLSIFPAIDLKHECQKYPLQSELLFYCVEFLHSNL